MRIFVMGDIHGAYKAMMQCTERAGFDYLKDTLVVKFIGGERQSYASISIPVFNISLTRG